MTAAQIGRPVLVGGIAYTAGAVVERAITSVTGSRIPRLLGALAGATAGALIAGRILR